MAAKKSLWRLFVPCANMVEGVGYAINDGGVLRHAEVIVGAPHCNGLGHSLLQMLLELLDEYGCKIELKLSDRKQTQQMQSEQTHLVVVQGLRILAGYALDVHEHAIAALVLHLCNRRGKLLLVSSRAAVRLRCAASHQ